MPQRSHLAQLTSIVALGLVILVLLPLAGGCAADVSNDARYAPLIGRSVQLSRPQAIWRKDGNSHANGASYLITDTGETPEKATYVTTLDPGQYLTVVAVRRRTGGAEGPSDFAIVRVLLPAESPNPLMSELHMSRSIAGVTNFPW